MSQIETTHDLTTFQGVFDYVAECLIKQGVPSRDDHTCLYRDPSGCKCAAGWLMPDDLYNETVEGRILTAFDADKKAEWESSVLLATFDERIPHTFAMRNHIHDLQAIHDRPDGEEEFGWLPAWREAMILYGNKNRLDVSILGVAA